MPTNFISSFQINKKADHLFQEAHGFRIISRNKCFRLQLLQTHFCVSSLLIVKHNSIYQMDCSSLLAFCWLCSINFAVMWEDTCLVTLRVMNREFWKMNIYILSIISFIIYIFCLLENSVFLKPLRFIAITTQYHRHKEGLLVHCKYKYRYRAVCFSWNWFIRQIQCFQDLCYFYPMLQLCIVTRDTCYQTSVCTAGTYNTLIASLAAWGWCSECGFGYACSLLAVEVIFLPSPWLWKRSWC